MSASDCSLEVGLDENAPISVLRRQLAEMPSDRLRRMLERTEQDIAETRSIATLHRLFIGHGLLRRELSSRETPTA
ncbi:hypothetical protein [Azospirillum sp. SYSU D00513]|uniref:hypothetical protein n=1 Tax=Azospirillum sp. SYSU D00513 TaxID=2812561 RepID=UPI001A97BB5A|nr:hypothetical protein [Azospirillum sp. SYSU D00513]